MLGGAWVGVGLLNWRKKAFGNQSMRKNGYDDYYLLFFASGTLASALAFNSLAPLPLVATGICVSVHHLVFGLDGCRNR